MGGEGCLDLAGGCGGAGLRTACTRSLTRQTSFACTANHPEDRESSCDHIERNTFWNIFIISIFFVRLMVEVKNFVPSTSLFVGNNLVGLALNRKQTSVSVLLDL